jgi:hypothetical protein
MADEMEVFRDLNLRGPVERRPELRAALIAAAVAPWRVDLERSDEVSSNAVASEGVLWFQRKQSDDYPAAGLTLWGTKDGYYVSNIVPLEMGNLAITQYNAILADFIARIADPVAATHGYTVEATEPRHAWNRGRGIGVGVEFLCGIPQTKTGSTILDVSQQENALLTVLGRL